MLHYNDSIHDFPLINTLQGEPPVSVLCEAVASALPAWRRTFANFPVLTWQQFSEGVHASINPLAGHAHLRDVGRQLHLMGEVRVQILTFDLSVCACVLFILFGNYTDQNFLFISIRFHLIYFHIW